MARSRYIFDIERIVEACQAAERKEGPDTIYAGVFDLDWKSARKAGKGDNTYVSLYVTDDNGVRAPLRTRVENCKVFSGITPLLQADVEEVNKRMASKGWAPKTARDKKPDICMQMYQDPEHQPETVSDEDPSPKMVDGKPVLPPPDKRHPLAYVMSCLNKFFVVTVGMKIKAREIGEMPMAGEDPLAPGAITCASTKRFPIVQEVIQKGKAAGRILANPLVRVAVGIPNTTDPSTPPKKGITYYDKKKPFTVNGQTRYEILTDEDGSTINAGNVHRMIPAGSVLQGVVSMDSICFSSMGISISKEFSLAVVDAAEYGAELTQDDYFGSKPTSGAIVPASSAVVPTQKVETVSEADLAALMSGLGAPE